MKVHKVMLDKKYLTAKNRKYHGCGGTMKHNGNMMWCADTSAECTEKNKPRRYSKKGIKMRDMVKIIDKIILVTPRKEVDFLKHLELIKADYMYTAPEDMQRCWHRLGVVFNNYIPYPPTHEWHDIVISIFTDVDKASTARQIYEEDTFEDA